MAQTIEGRMVAEQPQGPEFFRDAIAAYGREGTQEICEALIDSVDFAQQTVPLLEPVRGLALKVSENQGTGVTKTIQPYKSHTKGYIDVFFDPNARPEEIAYWLPRAITHETIHIAHDQHNTDFSRRVPEKFLFDRAIVEGVARYGENELLDPSYMYNFAGTSKRNAAIEESLITLLYDPGDNQYERHYDFAFGRDKFPLGAYDIGEYIVANMVAYRDLDITQIMRMPFDEYYHFVETTL